MKLPQPKVTVAIPTLHAGPILAECIASLERQTFQDFEIVIVDNSGEGRVRQLTLPGRARVIENAENAGYGAGVNQAWAGSDAEYIAVLNDDAAAEPAWLAELTRALDAEPRAGMAACEVALAGTDRLDSAAMLLCGDGSSKQRGHGKPVGSFRKKEGALAPSGSAAMYRRTMLEDTGGFDEAFFLYCEDTDLALRAQWAGWRCLYVPQARVDHRYSASAGRVSPLKAYLVERNRLFLLIKNFPAGLLLRAPFVSLLRYWYHATLPSGLSAESRQQHSTWRMAWWVLKAHLAVPPQLPRLLAQRWQIRRKARIRSIDFARLVREFSISAKQVAAQ